MADGGSERLDLAAERARSVLRACATSYGLRASAGPDGYLEVWARDLGISVLGICADGFGEVLPAVVASLEALTAAQSDLGSIPIHVRPDGSRGTDNAGGIDGNLWYVITHAVLDRRFGRRDLVVAHKDAIARAMAWVHYQDSDEDGFLESQEAADWADLLANRGKVLYTNVLYVAALRAYADLAEAVGLPDGAGSRERAARVAELLNAVHWPGAADPPAARGAAGDELLRVRRLIAVALWRRPFYLPWVAFRDFGDWCDVLGNSLAILCGIADQTRSAEILDYFEAVGVADPVPARAIHPSIQPGDKDWRPFYRQGNLNLPDQYQNGGAWPFIGGFLIGALVAAGRFAEARARVERWATIALAEPSESAFNEWYHGRTGRPMGKTRQAWSAALFLFARRAVLDGRPPWPEAAG